MASDSSSDRAVNRPLWVIAFSLAIIAVCLLLLVVQVQLREEPRNLAKPASSAEESAINTQLAPQSKPRRPSPKTLADVQTSATLAAEQGASAGETPAAPSEPPAPAPSKATSQNSGGYAPLSYLGQTNYQTAIVGKVLLHGTPPPETPIDTSGNPTCTGPDGGPLTTHFFVVGPEGELADTLVFIKEGLGQRQFVSPVVRHELVFTNCIIDPYVSAIMPGDELVARNAGQAMHSLRAEPSGSSPFAAIVKPGGTSELRRLSRPELFVRFRCEVHPWEFAYVSVLAYPFFAVTDQNGAFSLTNVPPGHYVLEAVHRKATGTNTVSQRISVNAHEVTSADFTIEAPRKNQHP